MILSHSIYKIVTRGFGRNKFAQHKSVVPLGYGWGIGAGFEAERNFLHLPVNEANKPFEDGALNFKHR